MCYSFSVQIVFLSHCLKRIYSQFYLLGCSNIFARNFRIVFKNMKSLMQVDLHIQILNLYWYKAIHYWEMDNIQIRIFARQKISIQFTNQKLKYYQCTSYEHFKISYLHWNNKKIQLFLQKYLHNSYNFMLNNHFFLFNNSWKSLCILKMNCKNNLK